MTRSEPLQSFARYVGLVTGPLLWALNTQLGQTLPYLECGMRLPLLAGVSALLVLLTLIAAYVAWRSDWAAQGLAGQSQTGSFLAGLGGLLGLLFAFAMLLQGTASLVMTGCER